MKKKIKRKIRTKVFAHKGYIGIQSNLKAEGLMNDPSKPGQLGFVVNAEYVDIQPAALTLLKKIKRSADDIGEIDVFKTKDNFIIFSWLGGPLKACLPKDITGSNSYDASLLKAKEGVETPQVFIDAINNIGG